jgi:hypothetical protein
VKEDGVSRAKAQQLSTEAKAEAAELARLDALEAAALGRDVPVKRKRGRPAKIHFEPAAPPPEPVELPAEPGKVGVDVRIPRMIADEMIGGNCGLPEDLRQRLEDANERALQARLTNSRTVTQKGPKTRLGDGLYADWGPKLKVDHFDIMHLEMAIEMAQVIFATQFKRTRNLLDPTENERRKAACNTCRNLRVALTKTLDRKDPSDPKGEKKIPGPLCARDRLLRDHPDLPRPDPKDSLRLRMETAKQAKRRKATELAEMGHLRLPEAVVAQAFMRVGYVRGAVEVPFKGDRDVWWTIVLATQDMDADKRGTYPVLLSETHMEQLRGEAYTMTHTGKDLMPADRMAWRRTLEKCNERLKWLEDSA